MYDVATYHNNIKVNNGFNSPADIAIIGRKEGRKRICTIPEYLEQCNCKSVCVCCKKCTNEKNIIDK